MSKLKHILIIGDNIEDLRFIDSTLNDNYKVTSMEISKNSLNFSNKNIPNLILLDINTTELNVVEVINNIRKNQFLEHIPVMLIVNNINIDSGVKCLKAGAVDFIGKTCIKNALLSRVKMHLEIGDYRKVLESKVKEKTLTIEHLQDTMIFGLAELVECRDENTGGHVKRTAKYVNILAEALADANIYSDILTPEFIKEIKRSAPLHDIGKIGINDSTLLKAGSLNEAEYEYIKKHAQLGGETLQKMISETNKESFLCTARDMAYYHHEKWNGTGYPKGLKGEEIPVSARIMAIADVYDALTTKRPYKEPFSHEDAVKFIVNGKSKMFDPVIVEVFENINIQFKNECIKLNQER